MKNGYINGRVKYKDICTFYSNGSSATKVAEFYKLNVKTVYKVLEKCNVSVRTISETNRKYKLNERFFQKINSEKVAYWFGFILADGWLCTSKKGSKIFGLTLAEKDVKHLEKLRDLLQPDRLLYKKVMKEPWFGAGNTYYKYEVSSVELYNDLVNLGCGERKSLTLDFPSVPKKYLNHFIRGYFDGDGSAYITCDIPCVSIMGTKQFLVDLLSKTNISETGKGIYSKRNDGKNSYYLQIKRPPRFTEFYNYIYNNATVYLERKKQVFDNYFEQQGCSETIITQPIK